MKFQKVLFPIDLTQYFIITYKWIDSNKQIVPTSEAIVLFSNSNWHIDVCKMRLLNRFSNYLLTAILSIKFLRHINQRGTNNKN